MSPEQLRKLAADLIAASAAPRMDQSPGEYVRNDAFRTLAASLLLLAEKGEQDDR